MAVVRSPFAHARIASVNLDAARAAEGVVAAFSGADLADDWVGGMPCAWPVTEDIKMPPHFPLATDEARFQGDGVAVIVAEKPRAREGRRGARPRSNTSSSTPWGTRSGPSKTAHRSSTTISRRTSATCGSSRDWDDFQAADLDAADVVVTRRYFQPRLIPNAIEPRLLAQAGPRPTR